MWWDLNWELSSGRRQQFSLLWLPCKGQRKRLIQNSITWFTRCTCLVKCPTYISFPEAHGWPLMETEGWTKFTAIPRCYSLRIGCQTKQNVQQIEERNQATWVQSNQPFCALPYLWKWPVVYLFERRQNKKADGIKNNLLMRAVSSKPFMVWWLGHSFNLKILYALYISNLFLLGVEFFLFLNCQNVFFWAGLKCFGRKTCRGKFAQQFPVLYLFSGSKNNSVGSLRELLIWQLSPALNLLQATPNPVTSLYDADCVGRKRGYETGLGKILQELVSATPSFSFCFLDEGVALERKSQPPALQLLTPSSHHKVFYLSNNITPRHSISGIWTQEDKAGLCRMKESEKSNMRPRLKVCSRGLTTEILLKDMLGVQEEEGFCRKARPWSWPCWVSAGGNGSSKERCQTSRWRCETEWQGRVLEWRQGLQELGIISMQPWDDLMKW